MYLIHVLTLASTAAAVVIGRSSAVSDDLTRRQASGFCTTAGFLTPYCCVPQADELNLVYAATSCVNVDGGDTITSITQFYQVCSRIQKIPLCCGVFVEGVAVCSAAVQRSKKYAL